MVTHLTSTVHVISATGMAIALMISLTKRTGFKLKKIKLKHRIIQLKIDFKRWLSSPDLPRDAKKCRAKEVQRYLENVQSLENFSGSLAYKSDTEFFNIFDKMGISIDISTSGRKKSIFKIDLPYVENYQWYKAYAIEVGGGIVLIFRPWSRVDPKIEKKKTPLVYTIGNVSVSTVLDTLKKFYALRDRDAQGKLFSKKNEMVSA